MATNISREWRISPPTTPPQELLDLAGGNHVVAELLMQRGLDSAGRAEAFLNPESYTPSRPDALYGLQHAAEVLIRELDRGHKILIWGDFDVDGQTSTALLASALRRLAGEGRVRYHIPSRFDEGHGIRVEKLHAWLSSSGFRPHCLLTCDTGISDGRAVGYAKDQGLTVIVTDHHDPSPDLVAIAQDGRPIWGEDAQSAGPESVRRADAVVDPKFQPLQDPLRTLPGVGVAFKLVEAVFALAGHAGDEQEYLDLVALGIVADVAEQVQDTRYLLQLGLRRLQSTKRVGLLALMEVAGLEPASVDAEAIGFYLAPRMNALGRLEHAADAVELLTTGDAVRAGQLAAKMERLNNQRRLLTSQITAAALNMIEHRPQYLDRNALVLAHEAWHPGIVGIVAARLVQEFHKPTVLLVMPPDEPARGSARSTPQVDIGASIAACRSLLLQFGGHPGAAGVALLKENIDRFREMLHMQIPQHTIAGVPQGLAVDAELELHEATLDLVEQIERLAPFGNGNPRPMFATTGIRVLEDRRIGRQGEHRRLQVKGQADAVRNVIWWNAEDASLPSEPIDLAYTLSINNYRGVREVQLGYTDSRRSVVAGEVAPAAQVATMHDLRRQEIAVAELQLPPAAVWYAEGMRLQADDAAVPYAPRHSIARAQASTLVIWSIPPSPDVLRWLVERTDPSEIMLCGRNTAQDEFAQVVRHVAGMCKFALEDDGTLHIDRMAARLNLTDGVIRLCLLWLEARGTVALAGWQEQNVLHVTAGTGTARAEDAELIEAQLQEALAEVRAYRRFFHRADVSSLGLQQKRAPVR